MVLAALVLTIIWWTKGFVNKLYASIFLLVMFAIFGQTPLIEVLNFPLSETFVMIVFSYVFSQGISNSKLAQKLIEPYLHKYGRNYIRLFVIIFILQFVMIFVIPQPFSRIILLSLIIKEFFGGIKLSKNSQNVWMFWIHASSVFINMTLIRGDLILNNALLNIANIQISETTWIKYMAVPSLMFYMIACAGFLFVFKKDIIEYNKAERTPKMEKQNITKRDKINLSIIAVVVVLWATESLHGISGTIIVILGSLAMFSTNMLSKKDLKCVDLKLMVFLTAAFSIGRVMTYSGTSDLLFSNLISFFPKEFNTMYILVVVLVSMVLHMVLGSNITTLSVALPGLLLISSGKADPVMVMFLSYIAVCAHFVLPFHQVIVLIGNGNKLYPNATTIKYAPMLTTLVIVSILFIYRTWWLFLRL